MDLRLHEDFSSDFLKKGLYSRLESAFLEVDL